MHQYRKARRLNNSLEYNATQLSSVTRKSRVSAGGEEGTENNKAIVVINGTDTYHICASEHIFDKWPYTKHPIIGAVLDTVGDGQVFMCKKCGLPGQPACYCTLAVGESQDEHGAPLFVKL